MSKKQTNTTAQFVKKRRKQLKITQDELAQKAGVGIRFVRDLEQGKTTMRMDKVNDVLVLFGASLAPANIDREKLIDNA